MKKQKLELESGIELLSVYTRNNLLFQVVGLLKKNGSIRVSMKCFKLGNFYILDSRVIDTFFDKFDFGLKRFEKVEVPSMETYNWCFEAKEDFKVEVTLTEV